jgi:hypothetical protein
VIISSALSAFWVVAVGAYFRHLRGLIDRIPDETRATEARKLGRDYSIALGVICGSQLLVNLVERASAIMAGPSAAAGPRLLTGGTSVYPWICVTAAAGVATLACIVMLIRVVSLHGFLRKCLPNQALLALNHWQSAEERLANGPPGSADVGLQPPAPNVRSTQ